MFAHCRVNSNATAFTISHEAPVIMAVFPSNNFIITVLFKPKFKPEPLVK